LTEALSAVDVTSSECKASLRSLQVDVSFPVLVHLDLVINFLVPDTLLADDLAAAFSEAREASSFFKYASLASAASLAAFAAFFSLAS